MLIWLFFVGDLLSIVSILGMHFDFIPGWRFHIWCILYLGFKGAIFFNDFLSIMDIVIALYMLLMLIFNVAWFFTYIAIAILAYKLGMTLLMR